MFETPEQMGGASTGPPGLHPIVNRGDGPAVDLGFKLYRELSGASKLTTNPSTRLRAGDIVRLDDGPSTSLRAGGLRRVDGASKTELFTDAATIRRVVDGDTLTVALAVAPGITLDLKLRLRGLDCPEIATAAGRAAKRFVNGLVCAGDEVVLSTTKPDKYDRYLADVFLRPAVGDKLEAESPPHLEEAGGTLVARRSSFTFAAERSARLPSAMPVPDLPHADKKSEALQR